MANTAARLKAIPSFRALVEHASSSGWLEAEAALLGQLHRAVVSKQQPARQRRADEGAAGTYPPF